MNKAIQYIVENPSLGTFLVAVLTFLITFANFYRNRASIEIMQFSNSNSVLIQPDIIDMETPDVYWHNDYRLIIDVVITNQSAKPISIIEFVLNDKMRFNSYHLPGEFYKVTIHPKSQTKNGLTAQGTEKTLNYPINNLWIQPIIDIPPHTSIRGHLFFHFADENMVEIGKNKLEIITSRKKFVKDLSLFEVQKSALPLPDSIHAARNRRDL